MLKNHEFQILAALGFLVSAYALYVMLKLDKSPSYSPKCDIRPNVSCSKALGSKYSKTLGIPNPVGGIAFYLFLFLLSFSSYMHLVIYPVGASVLGSTYLAYISYYKQNNFCPVCSVIYLINIALLVIVF
jgi:uncharacterized membrane protein